jgi:hypothetical protein
VACVTAEFLANGMTAMARFHQLLFDIFQYEWPSEYVETPIERRSVERYIRYAIMSRQIVYETSFLVVLCVLSLFLFPASAGPYPAVHGPATALQAARSSNQLQAAIAGAPKDCSHQFFSPFSPERCETACNNDSVPVTCHGPTSILRC